MNEVAFVRQLTRFWCATSDNEWMCVCVSVGSSVVWQVIRCHGRFHWKWTINFVAHISFQTIRSISANWVKLICAWIGFQCVSVCVNDAENVLQNAFVLLVSRCVWMCWWAGKCLCVATFKLTVQYFSVHSYCCRLQCGWWQMNEEIAFRLKGTQHFVLMSAFWRNRWNVILSMLWLCNS